MADQPETDTGDRSCAPVAVVGLACRLPGAPTADAFWRLLREGRSAIGAVPASRWPGTTPDTPRVAGLLEDVAGFDASFFGISPREAAAMDPQQRLMLELAWEALEDAGLAAGVSGTGTGVWFGVGSDEYAHLSLRAGTDAVGPHFLTGVHRSIVANRISYTFDLRGPSMTVDTGQSSGLVAIHLAADAVARGDCALALAGGVNLALLGEVTTAAQRFGALSADGHCYPFDERANGYVRGEGGGAVLLKPLAAALAAGDTVYCVVLGGATNNDGWTRTLTAPSRHGQEAVLAEAYRRAGVDPVDVQYVELHGTGTPVGDPVEAAALGAVIGHARAAHTALHVGSAKTNVGHLEAAAGVVGFLKVALSLAHGEIPATLNHERPHPAIPDSLGLRVVRETTAWPRPEGRRVASVSSFGMGGTNCHVVLASADPVVAVPASGAFDGGPAALPVAAHDAGALRATADALTALVGGPAGPAAVGRSLAATRTGFSHRAVVVADGAADAATALAALSRGLPAAGLVEGIAPDMAPIVFVFSGQGSQWPGMADELLARSPVFRARMAACERALRPHVDWSLREVLRDRADRVDVVQPVLFAVMVSMAALWRSAGVAPHAVVGHSQGEIAAACASGALSLQDAARIVAVRSRAVAKLSGAGGMLSVLAGADEIRPLMRHTDLEIAAVNSPRATVVAGPAGQLTELAEACAVAGIRTRPVAVDYAAHTCAIDDVRDRLAGDLAGLSPRRSRTAFYSSVTGGPVEGGRLDGVYWYRNLRDPVRFEAATRALMAAGHRVFIEMAPHPVLAGAIEDTAAVTGVPVHTVASLRRDDGGPARILLGLAEAYVHGAAVDWTAVTGRDARRLRLPAYPFQRRRHWLDERAAAAPPAPAPAPPRPPAAVTPSEAAPAQDVTPAAAGTAVAALTLDVVRAHTAAVLGYRDVAEVPADQPFKRLGLESFTALQLRNRLAAAAGVELPAACAYDHPTPAALAHHIDELRGGDRCEPLLADLTRLADSARRLAPGDELRRTVTARLHELVTELSGPVEDVAERVWTASVEELFDLIDGGYLTRGGHE